MAESIIQSSQELHHMLLNSSLHNKRNNTKGAFRRTIARWLRHEIVEFLPKNSKLREKTQSQLILRFKILHYVPNLINAFVALAELYQTNNRIFVVKDKRNKKEKKKIIETKTNCICYILIEFNKFAYK